jgi:hypothetical protein
MALISNLLLLQKFPSFDLNWSEEIKNKWFEIFYELKNREDQCGRLAETVYSKD